MSTPKSEQARTALLDAARASLVEDGFAKASARSIAGRAGVAPGLIYYHFDDLESLLAESSRAFSLRRSAVWEQALAGCSSLGEVVAHARDLHAAERELGSLVVLGQLLAGGRDSAVILREVHANFELFADIVERTIARILTGTPLDGVLDAHGLARTVSAGFLGLELLDDAIPDTNDLFEQLQVLATLADEVLRAGPLVSSVVRRHLRATGRV